MPQSIKSFKLAYSKQIVYTTFIMLLVSDIVPYTIHI